MENKGSVGGGARRGMSMAPRGPGNRAMGIRAVGLLSGGLDSTVAARLLLDQGIEVHAINFTSPFCTCTPKSAGCAAAVTAVRQLGGIPLKRVALGDDYLEIVKNPKYGHGSGLNPCIDCRIMKIQRAGEHMRQIGASFLFTGEVLGQRPMSQHRRALEIIDLESGLQGYILRPLSARHLAPTVPEMEGWVDRDRLLAISGRSRKTQMALAAMKDIRDYPCPSGGCLLTDKNFAEKMRDYLRHAKPPSFRDIPLLKIGRHFRLGRNKVVVARNEREGSRLEMLCRNGDHLLVPVDFSGPTVVLQGDSLAAAVEKMIQYTKRSVNSHSRISHHHKGKREILRVADLLG